MATSPLLDIPYLGSTDPPAIHTVTEGMADRLDALIPRMTLGPGFITTSSASLVDVTGGSVTVSGGSVEIAVQCLISPSGAGDAKVNLSIDGTDYGQIAQVNSGGAALTERWLQPGSTTGNALAGVWIVRMMGSGSKVIKTRALSTSGSASFATNVFVRHWAGGFPVNL